MSICVLGKTGIRLGQIALSVAVLCGSQASAASFGTPTTFATGAAVNSTGADSITYGGGSLWVEYSNGAPSTNYTGASTVVQYSPAATVQQTYTIAGSVDGLKYNPNTGVVWALQNQDALSQLTIITPGSTTLTTYTYGALYNGVNATRGLDDVAFIGNSTYMSLTNPASSSDPVILRLNNTTLSSPLTQSTVLTGAGILATDPDSLKSTPTGGLVLSGEGDGALTFVTNPGQASQTANSVVLKNADGSLAGHPDDSIYPTASSGTFYITDTGANTVYAIFATGLTTSSLFVNVGNEFGSVDPTTGIVTPIFTGTSPHGLEFVPSASAVPEPASLGFLFAGLAVVAAGGLRKRFAR